MRLQQVGRIEDAPHLPTMNLSIPTHPTKNHFRFDNESSKTPRSVGLLAATAGVFASFAPLQAGGLPGGCHVLAEHVAPRLSEKKRLFLGDDLLFPWGWMDKDLTGFFAIFSKRGRWFFGGLVGRFFIFVFKRSTRPKEK